MGSSTASFAGVESFEALRLAQRPTARLGDGWGSFHSLLAAPTSSSRYWYKLASQELNHSAVMVAFQAFLAASCSALRSIATRSPSCLDRKGRGEDQYRSMTASSLAKESKVNLHRICEKSGRWSARVR